MRAPAQAGILAESFGTAHLGQLIGISSFVSLLFGAASPYFTGFVFDKTGSYLIAFGTIALLLVIATFVALSLGKAPAQAAADIYRH